MVGAARGDIRRGMRYSRPRRVWICTTKFLAKRVTGSAAWQLFNLQAYCQSAYCTEFKYATKSDICCGLVNRGQVIFACRMRVNICGPCFQSAEMIVISE